MWALLPAETAPRSVEDVARALKLSGIAVGIHRVESGRNGTGWSADVALGFPARSGALRCSLSFAESSPAELPSRLQSGLAEWEEDSAAAGSHRLECHCELGDDTLADLHRQARAVACGVPDAPMVVDRDADVGYSAAWLRDLGHTEFAIPTRITYRIDSVADPSSGGRVWLHTHGLARWGCHELEIVAVSPEEAERLLPTLDGCALCALVIGAGPGGPIALDQPRLTWRLRHDVLPLAPQGVWSARRDADHAAPSGILVRAPGPPRRGYRGPETMLERLERHHLALDATEDDRLHYRALVRSRVGRIRKLAERHLSAGDGWRFFACVDGAQWYGGRPSPWATWVNVEEMREDEIVGSVCDGLAWWKHGKAGVWPLEEVTDWRVDSPVGAYAPTHVFFLERALAASEA